MISTDINANTGVCGKMSESTLNQLQKLQTKVRALEQANADLRDHRTSYAGGLESEPTTPVRRSESRDMCGSGEDTRKQSSAGLLDEINLIDLNSLEGTEANWLIDSQDNGDCAQDLDSSLEWLRNRTEFEPSEVQKTNLVSRLDELAKRSPAHSLYSPNTSGSSRGSGVGSPLQPYLASTPARAFPPPRGYTSRTGGFDPRTFSRGTKLPAGLNLDCGEEEISRRPSRDNGYHRLAYGSGQLNTTMDLDSNGPVLNRTFDQVDGGDPAPFLHGEDYVPLNLTASRPHNATFNSNLNATFEKIGSNTTTNVNNATTNVNNVTTNVNNATFDRDNVDGDSHAAPPRLNSTFNHRSPNKTLDSGSKPALNTTFDSDSKPPPAEAGHRAEDRYRRKMSEDRLSSASSSNRLSRESSNDGLLEDMEVLSADIDRLSTTSNMSESSASHRLNDVQDVQDLARRQEENLRHPQSYQPRSATISPSSEGSLTSPQQEEGGGYQSEESCGSETGGQGPRRQEKRANPPYRQYGTYNKKQLRNSKAQYNQQYSNQQYSSQDSLPDSPYSSQSLDSHSSQQGPDTRRSMPNLNQRGRGGTSNGGVAPTNQRTQYGLSQARHHNSDSRLQPPSRLQGPSRVSSSNLRAPTAVAAPQIKPPATTFAKPDPVRKYSGIARPTSSGGIPRPGGGVSRLPGPGGARSGISRGGSATGRRTGSVGPTSRIGYPGAPAAQTTNHNWQKDCY